MSFYFLKYTSPTWYYHLEPSNKYVPYFLDWEKLSSEEQALLDFDEAYASYDSSKLDAAWQAWNKGFILKDMPKNLDISLIDVSLTDNYRFVRKYFHPLWSWYILMLRIFCFNAPWKELSAFWKVRGIKRFNIYNQVFPHKATYDGFLSELIKEEPKVSIIIPTLNRYEYMKDVLKDLEQQSYSKFDVIVVDQSEPFKKDFYKDFTLDIKLIHQEEKALWLARNRAIKSSDANFLLLFDDDSRVNVDWVEQHLKCLDYFSADISSGVSISVVGAPVPKHYSFFRWSDQVDTGNVLIKRSVFEKVGLFDRQFEKQRMGDGEFGLRSFLDGLQNVSNPYAKRLHLKVGSGGLRQMGSWDGVRPVSIFSPRPIPSILYFFRRYFGNRQAVYKLLIDIPLSMLPYKFKGKRHLLIFYLPLMFILSPLVLFQVYRSWKLASKMIKEGTKIEQLK